MASKELTLKEKQEMEKGTGETMRPGPVFIPAVDIVEDQNEITVLAEMPGVDGKQVDIDLRENRLTIQGHVELPEGEREVSVYREFNYGDYFRQFTLSNVIDQAKITARIENGVLRLVLPKSAKAKPQKIQVASG
jgi:HSP20 family protein